MIYKKRINETDIKAILKWLRANGERGVDFDFTGSYIVEITINNSDLEQKYIEQWGKDVEPHVHKIAGWEWGPEMSEVYKWLREHGKENIDYETIRNVEIGEPSHVKFKFYNETLEVMFMLKWL